MPRAERLSTRLDTLLDAVFEMPSDPSSLYADLAETLRPGQLAPAQTKIRKVLRQKGEIRPDSAVLVACVLHLTGFPAHRILHFLSLYVPGGISLSLFELAVSAMFPRQPPIPDSLLYDLTRYTYLEKRLLARKSIEISEKLKDALSPDLLLYLYLLSLRDDLSNEHIQLITLVMRSCFPAQEVRSRIGGASLEEYGEIARAWKLAERRSLDLDIGAGPGADRRGVRAFDRNSASFFLDRYFSDEALAEMRAAAPAPSVPKRQARSAAAGAPGSATVSEPPSAREPHAPVPRQRQVSRRPAPAPRQSVTQAPEQPTMPAPRPSSPAALPRASRGTPRASLDVPGRVVRMAPAILAAVVVAILLAALRGPLGGGGSAAPAAAAPAAAAPPAAAPVAPAPAPPAVTVSPSAVPAENPTPETTTYVVKPGDSLWKIFTVANPNMPDHRGWMDFLSQAKSLNSLDNPDQLLPGRVLTLSPPR